MTSEKIDAAAIPLRMIGSVMRKTATSGGAPSSIAAYSRLRSVPCKLATMMRTMFCGAEYPSFNPSRRFAISVSM